MTGSIFIVVFWILVFMLPSLIAYLRENKHFWFIFILNLAIGVIDLGSLVTIGWVVALVWAVKK